MTIWMHYVTILALSASSLINTSYTTISLKRCRTLLTFISISVVSIHALRAEVSLHVVVILGRIGLAVLNGEHASVLLVGREVVLVAVCASEGGGALGAVRCVSKVGRLVARSAGPGLGLNVPEVAGQTFRAVVFFKILVFFIFECHIRKILRLLININSTSCELMNAAQLVIRDHQSSSALGTNRIVIFIKLALSTMLMDLMAGQAL